MTVTLGWPGMTSPKTVNFLENLYFIESEKELKWSWVGLLMMSMKLITNEGFQDKTGFNVDLIIGI